VELLERDDVLESLATIFEAMIERDA